MTSCKQTLVQAYRNRSIAQTYYDDATALIARLKRKVLRVALIACFTSILGCLFLALYLFSVRYLAKSRIEKKLFDSALAKEKILSKALVINQLRILEAEFGLNPFECS